MHQLRTPQRWANVAIASLLLFIAGYSGARYFRPPAPISFGSDDVATHSVSSNILIEVSGEVRAPGKYWLPKGSRIRDAVAAAGGFNRIADSQSIDLDRVLVDGSKLNVLSKLPDR